MVELTEDVRNHIEARVEMEVLCTRLEDHMAAVGGRRDALQHCTRNGRYRK